MKTIDLGKGRHTLGEVLRLAKKQAVLLRSSSGEDFMIEPADEFDREIATLARSARFAEFLKARSRETGDLPLREVGRRRRRSSRR